MNRFGIGEPAALHYRSRVGEPVGEPEVEAALEALAKKEVLVREGRRVTFDNPFFGRWVRRVVLKA